MRVLVCGSRSLHDPSIVRVVLYGVVESSGGRHVVIEGGAPGADSFAKTWARERPSDVDHEPYPADWERYGKAAGPIRNQQMIDDGKPDVVFAFVDRPLTESRGTNDMVQRAREAGIRTYVIEAKP